MKRFNATLVNHLFLLYFDTRAGYGDTGPVPGARATRPHAARARLLPAGRGRLPVVRRWPRTCRTTTSRPPWCSTASTSTITDFGTSNHTPEDYLDHLVGFGLYTTDGLPPGELRLVPPRRVRRHRGRGAQGAGQHYRNIAAMERDEKIRAGAYVYFTFLRPFAEEAGIADELDWTVPRDLPEPIYEFMSAMQGENAGVAEDGRLLRPLPDGDVMSRPRRLSTAGRRAGATRPATERLWGESWYFDFTNREGTLGGYVRLGLYPNLGRGLVLGLPGGGGPAARHRDRPRGAAAQGRRRWRSGPTACGPTTPSRRRSTT